MIEMKKVVYRYYSILRPVGPGTFPKKGTVRIHNFDKREYINRIDHAAWGYIEYDEKLTEKEARDYDLVYGGIYESDTE